MSNILGAAKTVELLNSFKSTVEEFAARAARMDEEFRANAAREKVRFDRALTEHNRETAAAFAATEAAQTQAKADAQVRYENRKRLIGDAYQSSKERGLQRIDGHAGSRRYEWQKRTLQAERDRETNLAGAASRFEEFQRKLAAEQEALAHLERSAQALFKGYPSFLRVFFNAYEKAPADLPSDEHQLLGSLQELAGNASDELSRLNGNFLLRVFKSWPFWVLLAVCELAAVPLLRYFAASTLGYPVGGIAAAVTLAIHFAGRFLVTRSARPLVASISATLARTRRTCDASHHNSELHYQQETERIKNEFSSTTQAADQELKQALSKAGEARISCRMDSDQRTVGITANHERMHRERMQRLESSHRDALKALTLAGEARQKSLKDACDAKIADLSAQHESARRVLEEEWKQRMESAYRAFELSNAEALTLFPSWAASHWADWRPPSNFAQAAQFGEINVDTSVLCAAMPTGKGLSLPGPPRFSVPLCLTYPDQGSVLLETGTYGHDQAVGVLNNIILRLLSASPPGRLNFTILDPVGLGQNFAGIMHLADYEEQLITNRIWTQSTQIEQKLGELNEHMEKVIQMYLRNEYQTIAEYNERAGVIAEKYHFLVVADFPANFTDVAIKRLLSIAASGARCGVYMLIHWDQRVSLPQDFMPDELRKSCFCLTSRANHFAVTGNAHPGADLLLNDPPSPERATEFVQTVGRYSRDSSRVEVPFEQVAPAETELWTEETTNELRVPIGRTGATKLQYLAIGKGTCQHGLVAGKTGSGKSTLFHVVITNLSLWCSPEQVEFYLVDFKKGVEFKCYAAKRLPHARVVAIESDREFGLSVLQRVDDELRRRGDLFRQLGVQDVAGYKRAGGGESIPRTLLLIDEFQEFFVEDDKIAQTASLLLDRIVRQGRAFGIHVLLGSQTLGGAYTVARTTLGQMVIRIALQCNEADAYLIMDDTNPAPRLLSRPGEGIYNDMAGALEGNSPFQVVWLPDGVRDSYLSKVRERADRNAHAWPGPIVFEGNSPADVRENSSLRNLLNARNAQPPSVARMWLGAPNSIKGPTEASFHRQSGNNLLLVGQREEAVLAIFSIGLLSIAAQFPAGTARIIVLDATPPGTAHRNYLEKVVGALQHKITLSKASDLPELMKTLAEKKKKRSEEADPDAAPPVFFFIHELQKFSRLRYEEDFSFSSSDAEAEAKPAAVLNDLVCEGTRLGFHVIASCDTYNNVSRCLSRKALSEFEMRVLFQMSVNDSASLIDSPKAGALGLHRALFYNAQEGYLETFRPYALPAPEWLRQVVQRLSPPAP